MLTLPRGFLATASLATVLAATVLAATGLAATASGAAPPVVAQAASADTLGAVRAAGVLRCGVNGASEDETRLDSHGDLTDLAADICKAVAVAVLGPTARTDLHDWPDEQHMLVALRDGAADLAIGAAPTIGIATGFDVGFAPPVFYDGLALLAESGTNAVQDLAGKAICFVDDASVGETLRAVLRARGITYQPFPFEEVGEMLAAAGTGHCAAISGNISQLVNMRTGFAPIEKRFRLLPTVLTMDPVAPVFRADDRHWAIIVTAVVNALIQAEESGVTAANAAQMTGSDDPRIRQLIGAGSVGRLMGLPDDWALAVIKSVGNYGEIFERSLGDNSDFRLPRGVNQPWSRGGVMYAPPLY